MQLNRQQKEQIVETLKEKIRESGSVFLTEYQGLTVAEVSELRSKLRESKCEYKVYKNTLCRRALNEIGMEEFAGLFTGPLAIAFQKEDPVGVAKALTEYSKDHKSLKVTAGLLGDKILSSADVEELASLPGREVLIAQVLGTMIAPLTGLMSVMQGNVRQLAYALEAIRKQKES